MPRTYDARNVLKYLPDSDSFADRLERLARLESYNRADVADHSEGVADNCEMLAKAIGFDEDRIAELKQAARWHDIGKLATPDNILRKDGKLDQSEFGIMKRHASDGVTFLGDDAPRMWKEVAAWHHERYDGHGYEGLKGEEIPLEARIVSIADVYDALIKERDYKAAKPEDVALSMMTADNESPGFGRRAFDPYLLRVFVMLKLADPEFEASPEIRKQLQEYTSSSPMDDIRGGWEANDGWVVKPRGDRIKYGVADNGNKRMLETRSPTGELGYTPSDAPGNNPRLRTGSRL